MGLMLTWGTLLTALAVALLLLGVGIAALAWLVDYLDRTWSARE